MYYATTFNQAGQEGQTPNSTYPKGGISFSKDSFVVNQTLVFQIKFCGKTPALRVAAKRHAQVQNRHNVKKQARESNFFGLSVLYR
jgi:hypothetical protein